MKSMKTNFGETNLLVLQVFQKLKIKQNGYSKAYAMTGFRIGYALASKR